MSACAQADTVQDVVNSCTRAYNILTKEEGFHPQDIVFDPNILPMATPRPQPNTNAALNFLKAATLIKQKCPGSQVIATILKIAVNLVGFCPGIQAVQRAFNCAFLHHACKAGLDIGIVNAAQVQAPLLLLSRVTTLQQPCL